MTKEQQKHGHGGKTESGGGVPTNVPTSMTGTGAPPAANVTEKAAVDEIPNAAADTDVEHPPKTAEDFARAHDEIARAHSESGKVSPEAVDEIKKAADEMNERGKAAESPLDEKVGARLAIYRGEHLPILQVFDRHERAWIDVPTVKLDARKPADT